MNRLEIIKEIHDLTIKEKKKKIREQIRGRLINKNFINSEKSFFDEWGKSENKVTGEQWHQFVRLATNFDEFMYMFQRVNCLVSRYRKSTDGYFKAKFQSGIAELPDRSSELQQIFTFSREYFEIYKKIINRMNFGQNKIDFTGAIRGKINWSETIKNSYTNFPSSFKTYEWKRKFDVPENVLLVWICIWLNKQIEKLLQENFKDPLDFDEIKKLKEISLNCKKIIKFFPFQEVIQTVRDNFSLDIKSKKIHVLELEIKNRIKEGHIENESYSKLLKWFRKVKGFNFPNIRKKDRSGKFLREATKNIDEMYEIWIFFEILHYFTKYVDVKLELNSMPHFLQFTLNHQEVKLYYEKTFVEDESFAWVNTHEPDFTIQTNQEIIGVLDAKNYNFPDEDAPKNKILAYMTNLGTGYGGIIWPKDSMEYIFPRNNKSDSTKYHKNLKLVFYSLNPNTIMNQTNILETVLEKIYLEIRNRLESATKCPKCGIVAIGNSEIERLFGYRKMGEITRVQSWCRECRSL
ncbi:hypothetical protein NZNM25_18660 [Nitrosopumilus zosterae]|uniref:DUF2357 domain-containing protein n=1 Tax=Nitrosopumilus zosterae TaxID=718286 RepID=A0A2S2KUC2_9ARCH|nr:hypothetical protein [Nitrosopumilus zosterae]BDQ31728.1 hypothetical protein NZOSNM25_001862 [Nitrosopumilus zosterae]GBH35075.1 hypothetical protein NZNM25_18660 [Nitrosopumilus zosterae]